MPLLRHKAGKGGVWPHHGLHNAAPFCARVLAITQDDHAPPAAPDLAEAWAERTAFYLPTRTTHNNPLDPTYAHARYAAPDRCVTLGDRSKGVGACKGRSMHVHAHACVCVCVCVCVCLCVAVWLCERKRKGDLCTCV